MASIAGLQYLQEYHTLVLLLTLTQYFHNQLKFVNNCFFIIFTEIWNRVRPGKFLQSHDFTIELATTENIQKLLFVFPTKKFAVF